MFDKNQEICVKRIHLVTDDGLYDQKAFYKAKIVFYSSSLNDGKFINYVCVFWANIVEVIFLYNVVSDVF